MENVDREIDYIKSIREIGQLLNSAVEKLNAITPNSTQTVPPEYIIDGVCKYYGIDRMKLCSYSRSMEIVKKRQLTARLLNQYTNCTQQEIAAWLGYRNHATVIHHLKQMENYLSGKFYGYDEIKNSYNQLLNHLKLN